MFTGLIAGQGDVVEVAKSNGQSRVRIHPLFAIPDPEVGESIAVNGVCLTAEEWDTGKMVFTAYISGESLSTSTLGSLQRNKRVNLERALTLADRLGGHMVSGHVDTIATVENVQRIGESTQYRLRFDPVWSSHIVAKGSVALDGISLTVNACGPGFLEVNIIPETASVTTISTWKPGTAINLETDIIGKYVSQFMTQYANGPKEESRLTLEFLRQNGF